MRHIIPIFPFMLATMTLQSCEKVDSYIDARIAKSEEGAKAARAGDAEKIADLEKRIKELANGRFRSDLRLNELENGSASVSTETRKYGILRNQHGNFTVLANDPRPFLDGYKVRLEIGNFTSVQFNGGKIHVWWSRPYDKKVPDQDMEFRDKVFDVTNVFRSGAYTAVDVALTPAKADSVKSLLVGLEFDNVSLLKAN